MISPGGVSISWTQMLGVVDHGFLMIGAFTWFFKKSTIGISMRAVSDDQFASMSIGISVPRVFGSGLGRCRSECGGRRRHYRQHYGPELQCRCILLASSSFQWSLWADWTPFYGAIVAGIIMGADPAVRFSGYLDGNWGLFGTADVLPYIILLIILLVQTPWPFRYP